jgi:hypothetical protein
MDRYGMQFQELKAADSKEERKQQTLINRVEKERVTNSSCTKVLWNFALQRPCVTNRKDYQYGRQS